MGFITHPGDPNHPDRFDEVYAGSDGQCYWLAWGGGAGDFESSAIAAGSLGSPESASDLVEVGGCFTIYRGVARLNLRGVRRDGTRWIKVMNSMDFTVIQDWTETPSTPNQLVSQASGGVPKHTHDAMLSIGNPL